MAIDLKTDDGMGLLPRFIAESDVFLTNFRPAALRRLQLEVDDVRARTRRSCTCAGAAIGARGPDANRAGYDAAAYFARTGMASVFTPPGAEWPALPRPAFGDVVGGLTIAGAISTALYQRAVTGVAPDVEVSLLGVGMWQIQSDIMNAKLGDGVAHALRGDRYESWNPLVRGVPDPRRALHLADDARRRQLLGRSLQGAGRAGAGERPALHQHGGAPRELTSLHRAPRSDLRRT